MSSALNKNETYSTHLPVDDYIANMDLCYVKDRLLKGDDLLGRQWDLETAVYAIRAYKNFLYLLKKYSLPLVPSRAIDEVWHQHILHTKQYTEDCQNIFGRYMHHVPSHGEEDNDRMKRYFERTQRLYFEEFGEELLEIEAEEVEV